MKGYKNLMNLPERHRSHDIIVKSKKPYQNGKIHLPELCRSGSVNNKAAYMIPIASGAGQPLVPEHRDKSWGHHPAKGNFKKNGGVM